MKCEEFATWLENRDTHDVSESDRAQKHVSECEFCRELLKKDEILDQFITRSMTAQPLPEGLRGRLDLCLDQPVSQRSRKGLMASIAALCIVISLFYVFNDRHHQFTTMDELGTFALADHNDHSQRTTIFESVGDAGKWLAANGGNSTLPPLQLIAGYTVKGARFCKLGYCRAVHMIYEKNGKMVSVFVVENNDVGFHLEQGKVYSIAIGENSVKMLREKNTVYAVVT